MIELEASSCHNKRPPMIYIWVFKVF